MGVTQEERPGSDAEDHDELDAAVTRWAEHAGVDQGAARAFARQYLRRLGAPAGATPAPEELGAEIAGAFAFADARASAPAAVRAFTPSRTADGYEPGGSVLETNTPDLPFLVDSVSAEVRERGVGIRRVEHPIVGVRRDEHGHIHEVCHPREGSRESVMHFELDRHLTPQELAALEDAVRAVLGDVMRVVDDFPAMRDRVDRLAELARDAGARYDADDVEDAVAFVEWLADEHFVFLGYREYEIRDGVWRVVPGSGLGILADERRSRYASGVPLTEMSDALRERATSGDLLVVSKTNRTSPIRRRERMDYVGVRRVAPDGEIVGEARFVGLFASRAYAESASTTPLLRRKLQRILDAEDLFEGSHDYKAAVRLFDAFPKDEVFAASTDDLRRAIVALLGLTGDQVRVLGRRDADGRAASLIVSVPRARFDAAFERELRALVRRRFGVDRIEAHEVLGEHDSLQLHLTVHSADADLPAVDFAELEQEVVALARTWDDAVGEELARRHGEERGAILAARWLERFPRAYKATSSAAHAAGDVAAFEALVAAGEDFDVGLQDDGDGTRVALYKRGRKVELSVATRLLEDLGLRVIEELPTQLRGDEEVWLQAFGVRGPEDGPLDLDACGERVAATLRAAWRGEVESDTLHRLVVLTGLDHREVEVLRAYRRYRQRLGSRYTETFQNDAIAANAQLCERLMRLFALRFDPSRERDEDAEARLREEILADLDDVVLLDHDRILRNQLGLIEATVRTTVFRPARAAIAFKLRSAEVPAMPQPAPLYEIYVYAPGMEGVHLRGGMIARGGIRWSERQDYRTEVFGLMRAQMTKNAVIVPDGAKGGFFLRHAPVDPGELRGAVREAYVTYVEALLDLTDDLDTDGAVVHPDGVRVLDGDDTYLVVAADKGTATFSDTANGIAERRGFWLGDAFASGGSAGYDHKKLGITARGAWESVKRHFRTLDVDPAAEDITVVGIGDMSGDVFGNGMLLSEHIRLVAAYDHRHVFLDPDPDAATGHAERRRLFELQGSSWDDYDRALISEGGGVWPRTAKSIPVSEQARAALGIEDERLAPADLIRAILRAPVDLLWNGGIGTVVKASDESDADARDRSSDAIRVDARELRCRVVGEGGNLGLTQRARIEASRHGVLVNADFIDNSAGVDCSDHEVNLKVLLKLAADRGDLDREARDALLEECTGDVVDHVLYDSFLQAQLLAQEVRGSAGRLWAYEDLMNALEATGLLHREDEALPSSEELAERRRQGAGLERPELAVLVAYAKRFLAKELLASDLLDDPALADDLRDYFPGPVVARFGDLLAEHPLRRELLATLAANDVVNALGPTFVSRMVAERGAEPVEVVRAYRVAAVATGARERWDAIEALDRALPLDVYWELMGGVDALVEAVSRWELANVPGVEIGPTAERARAGFEELWAVMPGLRSDEWREQAEAVAAGLVQRGAPEDLARAHAMQPALVHAPDVIAAAKATGRSLTDVARTFFLLGDRLRLEWLERQLGSLSASTRLQRWAAYAVADDVLAVRRALAERTLSEAPDDASPQDAVDAFLDARAQQLARLQAFTRALAQEDDTDLAGLTLAVRQLRVLAGAVA